MREKKLDAIIELQSGDSENLPFADNFFDAVIVAFGVRNFENLEQGLAEMLRVVKPGGRVLVVDFAAPSHEHRGLMSHFHRHGHTKPEDLMALLTAADLERIDSGLVGINDLHFALTTRPLKVGN